MVEFITRVDCIILSESAKYFRYFSTFVLLFYPGVEVLNNAIETLYSGVPVEKWSHVNVMVAPSSITISDHEVMC